VLYRDPGPGNGWDLRFSPAPDLSIQIWCLTKVKQKSSIVSILHLSTIDCNYRTAVHLITGHCSLNKHLHVMRKTDSCDCPLCGHCSSLAQLRGHYSHDYVHYLYVNKIFVRVHIATIVCFANHTGRLLIPADLEHLDHPGFWVLSYRLSRYYLLTSPVSIFSILISTRISPVPHQGFCHTPEVSKAFTCYPPVGLAPLACLFQWTLSQPPESCLS
jgi:hypothetical protein